MFDKNLIFKSAKNLKEYNASRKNTKNFHFNAYITNHLPKNFQRQQKLLLPLYKEAQKNKQKAVGKAFEGNYTLFTNNKKLILHCKRL